MEEEPVMRKKATSSEVDKRDLVNLDFYDNEITILLHKLNELEEDPVGEEVKKKVQHLKYLLTKQRHSLDEFRKKYNVEEIYNAAQKSKAGKKDKAEVRNHEENFFQRLKIFESFFKDIRQEVVEFINTR
jgi:hypothetical protein